MPPQHPTYPPPCPLRWETARPATLPPVKGKAVVPAVVIASPPTPPSILYRLLGDFTRICHFPFQKPWGPHCLQPRCQEKYTVSLTGNFKPSHSPASEAK